MRSGGGGGGGGGRGAGSGVWTRGSMIAREKKFGRVRLSTYWLKIKWRTFRRKKQLNTGITPTQSLIQKPGLSARENEHPPANPCFHSNRWSVQFLYLAASPSKGVVENLSRSSSVKSASVTLYLLWIYFGENRGRLGWNQNG